MSSSAGGTAGRSQCQTWVRKSAHFKLSFKEWLLFTRLHLKACRCCHNIVTFLSPDSKLLYMPHKKCDTCICHAAFPPCVLSMAVCWYNRHYKHLDFILCQISWWLFHTSTLLLFFFNHFLSPADSLKEHIHRQQKHIALCSPCKVFGDSFMP